MAVKVSQRAGLAETVPERAQPICAYDADGRLRWKVEVPIGGGHHFIWLDAVEGRVLALSGSWRATCLIEDGRGARPART